MCCFKVLYVCPHKLCNLSNLQVIQVAKACVPDAIIGHYLEIYFVFFFVLLAHLLVHCRRGDIIIRIDMTVAVVLEQLWKELAIDHWKFV